MNDLLQIESVYSFEDFTNDRALDFGLTVLKIVEEKNLKNVRIRVKYDGDIVFQYLMNGKKSQMWLDLKEKTVMDSGHSSLYVAQQIEHYAYMKDSTDYAVCGGGFPLIVKGELKGAFCVSGLTDTEDHQLILEALERMKKQ